jgi:hypothetical protein
MIHFYHIIIRLLQLAKNPKMGVMPVFFCLKANFSSSFCILNLFQYKAWFSIRPFLYLLSGGFIPCNPFVTCCEQLMAPARRYTHETESKFNEN